MTGMKGRGAQISSVGMILEGDKREGKNSAALYLQSLCVEAGLID
jgi:hypothetical protein